MGGFYCKDAFCSHDLKVKNFFTMHLDMSWLFATNQFPKMAFPFWNSLLNAWRNVQNGLVKVKLEVLKKCLSQFCLVTVLSCTLVTLVGCTHIQDFWDDRSFNQNKFKVLCVQGTIAFVTTFYDLAIVIPWDLGSMPCTFFLGGLNESQFWGDSRSCFKWVYHILEAVGEFITIMSLEFM